VILIISVLLWFLSSQGPEKERQAIRDDYAIRKKSAKEVAQTQLDVEEKNALLQTSYAGQMGHWMEPIIKPLGFDWKIGIALITSFAAREVFVGTMATLYSAGDDADEHSDMLRSKMAAAEWPDGKKVYTLASGMSLLMFYVLAMQCMSTLAVVKRETKSWKWPMIQLAYMTGLAYLFSWIAYQLLS
jgi:ferrous iron transport protein B